jgi:hypothetical protein
MRLQPVCKALGVARMARGLIGGGGIFAPASSANHRLCDASGSVVLTRACINGLILPIYSRYRVNLQKK